MATLTGKFKVYKKEKMSKAGNTFYTFSLGVSSKDTDGNWHNGFLDAQFKKADAERITNKCKIDIKNAFPIVDEYNDKTYVKWFVNDFTVEEEGEQAPASSVDEFGFSTNISEDDMLPFAAPTR